MASDVPASAIAAPRNVAEPCAVSETIAPRTTLTIDWNRSRNFFFRGEPVCPAITLYIVKEAAFTAPRSEWA